MVFSSNIGDPWPYQWPYPNYYPPSVVTPQKDILDEFKKAYRVILEERISQRLDVLFSEDGEFKDVDSDQLSRIKDWVMGEVYNVLREDPLRWP